MPVPGPAYLFLVLMFLAAPGRAADKPTAEQVAKALEYLDLDNREQAPEACRILAAEGSAKSIAALADFGVKTLFQRSTIAAGTALASAGEDVAALQIERLLRGAKKLPQAMARAVTMAEQIPGHRGTNLLLSLAKEKREVVAATATRALGKRADEGARDTLLLLLKSGRDAVAAAAAFSLSRLPPDPPTMEALFKRAQGTTNDERVGDSCALALSRMEGSEPYGERALSMLISRSTSESFHALVKLAMRADRNPSPELLEKGLAAPADEVREVVCDMIGLLGLKGYGKTLFRLATSERDWRNTVSAWLALKRSGIEEVIDGIKAQIRGKGEACYWALQCAIAHPHADLLESLRDAALDTKDPVRRELAQRALRAATQELGPTRDYFLEVARTNRGTLRAQAAWRGIGNLKDGDSFHALVKALEEEKDGRFQLHILKGLERLTGHYFKPDPAVWNEWYEVVEGEVSYEPKKIDRKQNRERVKQDTELGMTPATEAAVENGLLWLSRHQDLSGGWNGAKYHENCIDGKACAKEGGMIDRPLAYTALAILAFQGAGYTHLEGPYRDVIQRGFEYILSHQDYDGSHYEKSWTYSYEAAVVCQALCDGYALTGDRWLGDGAQRMIDYLVKVQYPGRTWRYQVRASETDTSVMSWILLACISARTAGLDIPEQIFVASEAWLDTACDPIPPDTFEVFFRNLFDRKNTYYVDISKDERGQLRHYKIKTWYQPPRLYTPAMSAIGLIARIWMGWTRGHPFCIGAANQVSASIPGYGTGLEHEYAFYPYTWYYGSLAMYQMGGRYWTRWKDVCLNDLIKNQKLSGCPFGSWEMPRQQFVAGLTGGTVYCTCMTILSLETFYRYQPYLARHELRSREDKAGEGEGRTEDKGGGPPAPPPPSK